MTFRNLDDNHDWNFGKGLQNYVKNSDELKLNLKTRLLSFLDDCFFAKDEGIDWFNHLGGKDQDIIIRDVKRIIANTTGVKRVLNVEAFLNDERQLTLEYNIEDIYQTSFTEKVEVLNNG